jgi:hypothetical protein
VVVKHIPTGRLVDGQKMRFYNLHPASGGRSAFLIVLHNGGNADEFEDQIARRFIRCERINRVDQDNDLCHDARIIKED